MAQSCTLATDGACHLDVSMVRGCVCCLCIYAQRQDGIAIVSLGDPAIMTLSQQQQAQGAPCLEAGRHQQVAAGLPAPQESTAAVSVVQQQDIQQQGQDHMHAVLQPALQGLKSQQAVCCQHQYKVDDQRPDYTSCPSVRRQDDQGIMSSSAAVLPPDAALQSPPHLQQQQQQQPVQLLLKGGDVLLLQGQARYDWLHGLAAVEHEVLMCSACRLQHEGIVQTQQHCVGCMPILQGTAAPSSTCQACMHIVRGRRVSITLRKIDPECTTLCTEM